MNEQKIDLIVEDEYEGMRIDKFIAENDEHLSRSYIQKLIKEEIALVNEKPVKASYKVLEGDKVSLVVPEPEALHIEAENIPLDILYEDRDVIVINKPKGMVVHPAAGHYTGTLVNALMYHCKDDLSGINGVLRPGIVHRIDMDTTGAIIVCKNDKAHTSIAAQLKEHSITRKYNALVYGALKEENGTVNAPIARDSVNRKKMTIVHSGGKNAVTHYRLLENLDNRYAHIECELETGRTHQIRVHMASIHHPLIGDEVYGPSKQSFKVQGQCLHARVLGFVHPITGEYMEFEAPLPEYFDNMITKLRR